MTESRAAPGRFVAFFRRYTKTWYHALATAALTAFGTLTVVDNRFAALALAAYVLPPVGLYVTDAGPEAPHPDADGETRSEAVGRTDREAGAAATSDEDTVAETASPDEGGPASIGGPSDTDDPDVWTAADTPTDEPLRDVAVTDAGAYAVGDGGVVIADEEAGWDVVLADGPGADSASLTGVAATADGVWVAGDGGAVGRLDPATGRHVDLSAPDGDTTNLAGIAAAEGASGETVVLIDGSGRVRRGRYRDGETTWAEPVTPGSGSSLSGITLLDDSTGYVCDTSGSVFELADGGRTFDRIGVDDADGTFTDVAATAEACLVGADDGVVHRSDGSAWTPVGLDADAVRAVAAGPDRRLAAGDTAVFERAADGADWERAMVPGSGQLHGVALGGEAAVAVGDDGTVVERS